MNAKTIFNTPGFFILIISALLILIWSLTWIGPGGTSIIGSTKTFNDTVINIYEGGVKDIVFSLKHHKSYYINRGLENGLNIDSLRQQLINNKVTISYASPTTHISELVFNSRVIYSQLRH